MQLGRSEGPYSADTGFKWVYSVLWGDRRGDYGALRYRVGWFMGCRDLGLALFLMFRSFTTRLRALSAAETGYAMT